MWTVAAERSQEVERSGVIRFVAARLGVQDDSASDYDHGRKLTNDEAVARKQENFVAQLNLRKGHISERQVSPVQKNYFSDGLRGALMEMNLRALLQRPGVRTK